MKLTLKSSLGEFQNLMGEGLGDHLEVLDLFRESTPFSHFLDVKCIPPPLFLWQLIAREAKIKRKGEMWFVFKGVPVRGEVHIPVERKRKARNVPSPTRDNSEERNEHISSPQESQRSQSLRESPSRVSHSNIPNPSSPNPHPAKPSSNTFQELFDRMSKKIYNIAEEQRKRFEVLEKKVDALSTLINQKIVNKVPETTIMGDCEETEARNPSPDHKAESTHETMGTEDATSMKPLQEMVESCHEVMETDAAAASMKPLQAESTHETMGIEDAASMKPLQEMVVSPPKELGEEAEITDAIVYGKRVKKKSASLKSPYTADGRKKKKADELLSKPPTKADLLEFKSFIVKAIKDDRPVQCYLAQYKEIQEFLKTGFKGIAGIREIGKHGYADWEIEYCPVPQQIDCDCGILAVIASRYHPLEERFDIYTRIGCYPVRVVLGDDAKHQFAAENGWRYFLYDHQCQNLWHILFKKLSETAYTSIVISTLGSEVDYPIRIPDYDSDADDVTYDDDDVFVCKFEESHFRESSQKLPLSEEFCEANAFVEGKIDVTLIGPNMQPVVCTLKVDCIGDGFLKRMWSYFVDSNGLRVGDKLVMRPVGNNTFMVGVYRHHKRDRVLSSDDSSSEGSTSSSSTGSLSFDSKPSQVPNRSVPKPQPVNQMPGLVFQKRDAPAEVEPAPYDPDNESYEEWVDRLEAASYSPLPTSYPSDVYPHVSKIAQNKARKNLPEGYVLEYDPNRPNIIEPHQDDMAGFHFISLESGTVFPLRPLLVELCHCFKILPGQITPNAHRFLNAFVNICVHLKIDPSLRLFLYLFEVLPDMNFGSFGIPKTTSGSSAAGPHTSKTTPVQKETIKVHSEEETPQTGGVAQTGKAPVNPSPNKGKGKMRTKKTATTHPSAKKRRGENSPIGESMEEVWVKMTLKLKEMGEVGPETLERLAEDSPSRSLQLEEKLKGVDAHNRELQDLIARQLDEIANLSVIAGKAKSETLQLKEENLKLMDDLESKERDFPGKAKLWMEENLVEASRVLTSSEERTMEGFRLLYREEHGKEMITQVGSYAFMSGQKRDREATHAILAERDPAFSADAYGLAPIPDEEPAPPFPLE
ncbi:unnamed protein product [Cuscuta campestris]|uniref:Transposase (putative) gypsy type domain-containing protein n=1 Tax=Cuscuta campestris TaxID=132261 RepID=A0A484LWJ8_9ASTE|nr:unnamed protein product [Cuscuta campestris]